MRNPETLFLLERKSMTPEEAVQPVVLRGTELCLDKCQKGHERPEYGDSETNKSTVTCSYFLSRSKPTSLFIEVGKESSKRSFLHDECFCLYL